MAGKGPTDNWGVVTTDPSSTKMSSEKQTGVHASRWLETLDKKLADLFSAGYFPSLPAVWRYAFSLFISVIAIFLRWALIPWLGDAVPYAIAFPAIIVVTVLFGVGPGLVSVVLLNLGHEFFISGALPGMSPGLPERIVVFLTTGVVITYIVHAIRLAQKRAGESEMRFASFAAATFEGIVESLGGRILDCNEQFAQMVGYTVAELKGMQIADLTVPEDREAVMANIRENRQSVIEQEVIRKDGSRIIVEARGRPILGGAGSRHTAVRDITERKRAEQELRESERRLRERAAELTALFDAVPAPVFIAHDPDCLHISGNRAADELLRNPRGGEASLSAPSESRPGHFRPIRQGRELKNEELPAQMAARGIPVQDFDYSIVFDDGTVRDIVAYGTPLLDLDGQPRGSVTVQIDVTERSRAEQALFESEGRYRTLFNTLIEGFCIVEVLFDDQNRPVDYRFLEINPAFEKQTGLHDAQGKWMRELAPDHEAHWFEIYGRIALTGEPERFENEARALGRWYEVFAYRVGRENSRKVAILFNDITERKRVEEQLRELSQRLTYHVDNSPLAVIEWGPDMRLTRWSGEAERMFGWTAAEVLGKRMEEFQWIYTDDQSSVKRLSEGLMKGIPHARFSFNRNYRKDGSVAYCEWYNSSLLDERGNLRSILSLVLDVTDRKQTEARLQASLAEKEVMLKEIHHRVKNNLQVICSLLDLQSSYLQSSLREPFKDVRDRVRTMALVHERLYQSESLALVEFDQYTRSLLNYIWQAHGASAARVRLRLELQPVSLPVDIAIPCGLILNELAGNAIKHAFPGETSGELAIDLQTDGRSVEISISDDGVGLPPGVDWATSSSLGLRLVHMLAGQLHADVQVSAGKGTRFQICFAREQGKGGSEMQSWRQARLPLIKTPAAPQE